MSEIPRNRFETEQESIPSKEEIKGLFDQLIEGGEYSEVRMLEDEKGVYLWDIVIQGEDGNVEYSYMRKGRYKQGQASGSRIDVTFYDKDGMPVGGHSVAKIVGGKWKLTP